MVGMAAVRGGIILKYYPSRYRAFFRLNFSHFIRLVLFKFSSIFFRAKRTTVVFNYQQ